MIDRYVVTIGYDCTNLSIAVYLYNGVEQKEMIRREAYLDVHSSELLTKLRLELPSILNRRNFNAFGVRHLEIHSSTRDLHTHVIRALRIECYDWIEGRFTDEEPLFNKLRHLVSGYEAYEVGYPWTWYVKLKA